MKKLNFSRVIIALALMLTGTLPSFAHDFYVNGIYYNITSDTDKTVEVTYEGAYCDSYSNDYTGSVVIPSTVTYSGTTYSVTSIDHFVFYNCPYLTSITIPNSVTSIGDYAFDGCRNLAELIIEDGENKLSLGSNYYKYQGNGEGLFYDCPLEKLYLGRNLHYNTGMYYGYSPFYKKSKLKKITIGNSVTEIGDYTFSYCTGLTSVTIPNSVISIGNDAFDGCTGLKEVTIGNSVTSIGNYAFDGCTGLKEVTIGNSVTSIGNYAFDGCTGLTSVTIPNSVTEINNYAFDNCSNLAELIIEDGTETLSLSYNHYDYYDGGQGLFYDCPLEKLYLGRNLDYDTSRDYGYSPFYKKSTLKEITIGNSITSIGDYAFYDCIGLTSVTIPNSVTSIGNYAFSGCSMRSVIIPNSVTSIGNYAFSGCSGLTSVTIPNSVTSIGNYAFSGCTGLTSVTIPNSVTSIGNYAFSGCTRLTSVTIPYSVTSIGYSAFSNCTGLTKVNYNAESCTSMGSDAFYNCTNLKTINIGNSVKTIPSYAFYGCSGLTSVTIPESVTSIGGGAFSACHGLTEVNYNAESCTSMGSDAFYNCTNLKTINIGNSVKTIPGYAFSNCTSLTEVNISDLSTWCKIDFADKYDNPLYYAGHLKLNGTEITYLVIPDDITEIKAYAFSGCTGLRSVTIPNSVTVIGYGAFDGCTGLTEVNISDLSAWCKIDFAYPNPLYYAGHLKLNGTEITNLVIPDDITEIKAYAFSGCRGLTSVTIPNSVTSIGNSAFYVCTGLTSITIPNSVTYIGYSAFSSSGLRLIFSYCMTPPTCGDGAFYGCYDARLMVPEGTYYDYLVANEWYKFDKIQEFAGIEGVEVDNNAVEIARYDIYGRLLTEPTKGINIIKMSDGSTRKEYVK